MIALFVGRIVCSALAAANVYAYLVTGSELNLVVAVFIALVTLTNLGPSANR